MDRTVRARKITRLSPAVQKRLNSYALAATATGVAALALVQSADAKIVYTPANVQLQPGKPYPLDLNHDGKIDFFLLLKGTVGQSGFAINYLAACHRPFDQTDHGFICASSTSATNALNVVRALPGSNGAAALRAGAKIQPDDRFIGKDVGVGMGDVSYKTFTTNSPPVWGGAWVNGGKGVKDRYLGLKFKINGKSHLGWARLSVTTQTKSFSASLSGYAYETVAGELIIAGATQGKNDGVSAASSGDATGAALGALALGAGKP
jgi:hypothetical protein